MSGARPDRSCRGTSRARRTAPRAAISTRAVPIPRTSAGLSSPGCGRSGPATGQPAICADACPMKDALPPDPNAPENHRPGCCGSARRDDGSEAVQHPVAAALGAAHGTTDGMVLLPGGVSLMGDDSGEGYPADGEGAGTTRSHRSVLDRRAASSRTQRSPRSSPRRVTSPRPSASAGRSSSPGCCPTTSRRPGPSPQRRGGARSTARTGAIPKGPQSAHRRPRRSPGRPRLVERRRGPTAAGRASACRPRPSGSTRRAAGSSSGAIPGATS